MKSRICIAGNKILLNKSQGEWIHEIKCKFKNSNLQLGIRENEFILI